MPTVSGQWRGRDHWTAAVVVDGSDRPCAPAGWLWPRGTTSSRSRICGGSGRRGSSGIITFTAMRPIRGRTWRGEGPHCIQRCGAAGGDLTR